MLELIVRLNTAKVQQEHDLEKGVVKLMFDGYDDPPIFVITDIHGDTTDTFFVAYKEGRWTITDYASLTDAP
jgi:hypothetical protein